MIWDFDIYAKLHLEILRQIESVRRLKNWSNNHADGMATSRNRVWNVYGKRHIFPREVFPHHPPVIWIYFLRVHAKFFASYEPRWASSARVSHKIFNATKRPTFLGSREIVGNNYAFSVYVYGFFLYLKKSSSSVWKIRKGKVCIFDKMEICFMHIVFMIHVNILIPILIE